MENREELQMMRKLVVSMMLLVGAASCQARAGTFTFSLSGAGISGTVELTYGAATDSKYPQAFEVTGISGTFSDANIGIANASILGLVAVKHDTPEPGNLLAPHDFSRFAVATGLSPVSNGFLTYTNLYWPGGSPQTATDYPGAGGFLDIYGLLFDIGGGRVVNVWSNGDPSGTGRVPFTYGVGVATADRALDYVSEGVVAAAVPEPGSLVMLGIAATGLLACRRGLLRGRVDG